MNSDIKLALRAALAEKERSLIHLSVHVASLCEKHGSETTRKACHLLLTETQPVQPDRDVAGRHWPESQCSKCDGDVGLDAEEFVASHAPTTRRTNMFRDDVAWRGSEVSVDTTSHRNHQDCANELSGRISARSKASTSTSRTPIPRTFELDTVPPHVMQDSRLKNLPFIHPEAGVEDPLPKLVYILGPRALPWYRAFMGKLQSWQPMDNSFSHFVRGAAFQCLCALAIVANFVFIAAKANWHATHTGQDDPGEFSVLAYFFTSFYTLELAANLAVHGGTFWIGDDCGWNVFDFCIVSMGLIETVITASGGDFVDASFLRMLRFARISRVLRMFSAVRMFKEIRIMVDALVGSLSIFVWSTALFVLMIALFAIFFVQGYSSHMETRPGSDSDLLKEYFGSVSAAMMSLFMCATGGSDWKPYYDEAANMGAHYKYFILFFIGFYHFSFFNVITSVFCEKALSLAKPTLEELLSERYQKEFNDARELYSLLNAHLERDETKSTWHNIDAKQFEKFIEEPTVERFFEVRGVGPSSARRFFRMLCELNGTHRVDFPTFVSACITLDGSASSIDQHVMSVRQLLGMHQIQALQRIMHSDMQRTQEELTNHLAEMFNEETASLRTNWREELQKIATPKSIMSPASPTMDENRSAADHMSNVLSVGVVVIRSILTSVSSEIAELKSVQKHIQSMQSHIQHDLLQPTLSEKKDGNKQGFSDLNQRAFEVAHQHAAEASQRLPAQQRVHEDRQTQLAQQPNEKAAIIAHLTEMSQQRETHLKKMLGETTKRWEQTQLELQRALWRNEPRNTDSSTLDTSILDTWCSNLREFEHIQHDHAQDTRHDAVGSTALTAPSSY